MSMELISNEKSFLEVGILVYWYSWPLSALLSSLTDSHMVKIMYGAGTEQP
jgi:hypothetical protein